MENLGWSLGAGAASVAAAFYLTRMPKPTVTPPVDLNDQSYILEDGSRSSKLMPKGELLEYMYEDTRTLYDCFQRGIRVSNNGPCLGARTGPNQEYEWISYQEVYDRALAFGSWMLDQGIQSHKEVIIGIYSINRIEWVVTEQACNAFSVVPVALYDTLGEQAAKFIINQTTMKLVVCDTATKANQLLQGSADLRSLNTIVVIEGLDGVDTSLAKGITLLSYQEAINAGKKNLKKPSPPKPDEVAMICYTSGTTGNPKGVLLTHKNIVADISGVYKIIEHSCPYKPEDRYLSYLPLPHMYERLCQGALFCHGVRVGFFRGDIKLLLDDFQTLKPTIVSLVPRLINRIYDKVMAGVASSPIKSKLMEWAINSKTKEIQNCVFRRDSIWDKLIFKKVQAILGGETRVITTGSAPLEKKVLDFFRIAFGCTVAEGYGQTEAVAAVTLTMPGEYTAGHVGPPFPCNVIKLFDCPEENYFAKDNQGEVCAKGHNIFKGYYKDPEKTAEALDTDGWLHTGDIGEWLPNGTLKIIDRKKNLFKLSQGEYVAPERLENIFSRSTYVAQTFVEGDSLQPYLMAVIVPDEEVLMGWAKAQGLSGTMQDLCMSESVKDMILADINKVGKESGLQGFELAKDIYLQAEPFSVENNLLTPTFKSKRPELRKYFARIIKDLYQKHSKH